MKKNTNFVQYFFELMVVFVGITAAFMLDQWAENQRNRKTEKQYFQSLYEEVKKDSADLAQVVDFYRQKKGNLEKLIGLLKSKNASDSTEMLVLNAVFNNSFFKSNIYTWDSIKEGGELKIIRSFQIKLLMSKLYKMNYALEKYQDLIYDHLQKIIIPYSLEHIDLNTMKFTDHKFLLHPYFVNAVVIYYYDMQAYLQALEETNELITEIKREIETEI